MSASAEKVNRIIRQIEGETEEQVPIKEKTMDEVIHIFLEHNNPDSEHQEQVNEFQFDMEELQHWKRQVNQTYSIHYDREILCFRKYFRKPVIFVKRIIRKLCRSLIQPIVEEQNVFNANVTAAVNALYNNAVVTEAFMGEIHENVKMQAEAAKHMNEDYVNKLFEQLAECSKDYADSEKKKLEECIKNYIDKKIDELAEHYNNQMDVNIEGLKKSVSEEVSKHIFELEKRYEKLKIETERNHTREEMLLFRNARLNLKKEERTCENNETDVLEKTDVYTGIDYFDFENQFRGSRQEIKDALSIYIPYYMQADTVIDLGCGRGEFLELLKENAISGIGVDNYAEFVAYCNAKRFNVVCDDALNYLAKTEKNSIGGIFAAQLIEHLTNDQLLMLCHLAYEKLEKNGCIILESPNPMCLSIYRNAFYIDPSHQKPVHPKTVEYLLKREGFREVEILFTEGSKSGYRLPLLSSAEIENLSAFNNGMNLLSDILFGSEDYAVIATK